MFTLTRATAGGDNEAEVAVPAAAVSGIPTHTGRVPARPDPADGPASSRDAGRAVCPPAAMTAVAVWAAGQKVCGRDHGRMAGTATFRPLTGWTATGLPADAAGARPQPPNTPT